MARTRIGRWGAVGMAAVLLLFGLQVIAAAPSLAATGQTIGSSSVPVYSGPGSENSADGSIPVGTEVSFSCFVAGQDVSGPYGTEDLWDALDSGGYVSDALIYTGSNSAVAPACPSAQFGTGTYPIAWTASAQPMSSPSTGSGADGGVIAAGTLVSLACETTGDTVTDSAGFANSLWDQLSSGGYVPNVYLDTQVNGATPGVSTCSAPAPAAPSGSGQSGGAGSSSGTSSSGSSGSPDGSGDDSTSLRRSPGT